MENKRIVTRSLSVTLVILSIATFIICLILNCTEFQRSDSATLKNVIVTFSYAVVWILVLITGIISRNSEVVKYSSAFWSITLVTTIIAILGDYVNWIVPLVLLFRGQWYGIKFFVWSDFTQSIIIGIISLVMLAIAVIWLIYNKNKSK